MNGDDVIYGPGTLNAQLRNIFKSFFPELSKKSRFLRRDMKSQKAEKLSGLISGFPR